MIIGKVVIAQVFVDADIAARGRSAGPTAL
jgi:hypothetical protein